MNGWKRGLPPGGYYEGMTDDYEVYFSPGGVKWHRRLIPAENDASVLDAQHPDSPEAQDDPLIPTGRTP